MNKKLLKLFAPIFLFFFLILLWEFIINFKDIPHYIIPKPSLIFLTLVYEWHTLFPALLITVYVTFIALLLAVVIGVLVAIIISQFRIVEISLMPYAIILQVTPVIAIAPLIIILVDKPIILRLGGIERTKINKVLNKNIKYDRTNKKITVPGQSKLHYSPGIPIKLNTTKAKPNEAFILIKKRKKSYKNYYYLSKTKNLKEAAKNLYKILRVIKNKNYKSIVVEKIPNIGFGEAINDRLKRASTK